ncbi:hypothetical protein VIGAN_01166200 [Vigna angularis var. angularis]|uniref:Uncharacterized protein n=1 Tax=Vigna angularis var. angularis TaxID=157739 RepID=A0A0S3R0D7_PHAAN|nr:hypothetical protein VIGAN_01166200 [Vigna angularis var. angularis]
MNQLSSFNLTTVRVLLSPSNHLFILTNKGNECCQVLVCPIILHSHLIYFSFHEHKRKAGTFLPTESPSYSSFMLLKRN